MQDFNAIALAMLIYGAALVFATGFIWRVSHMQEKLGKLKIALKALLWLGDSHIFKKDKLLWAVRLLLRISVMLAGLRYLRYLLYPVPQFLIASDDVTLLALQLLPLLLLAEFSLRSLRDSGIALSGSLDMFFNLLLTALVVSGLCFHYLSGAELLEIKAYTLGLVFLRIEDLPAYPLFSLHVVLLSITLTAFAIVKFYISDRRKGGAA